MPENHPNRRRKLSKFRRYLGSLLPNPRPSTRAHKRKQLRAELLEDRRLLAGTIQHSQDGQVYAHFVSGMGGWLPADNASRYIQGIENSVTIASNWNGPKGGQSNVDGNPMGWPSPSDPGQLLDFGSPPTHRFHSRRIADHLKDQTSESDFVVLVGYSLGGTTVLEAAELARFDETQIDVLATIDPVSTGPDFPGRRYPLQSRRVYSNVENFFNRWQTKYPYPLDYGSSGSIPVDDPNTTVADQRTANDMRREDGSRIRRGCQWFDYINNYCIVRLFNSDYTTATRHEDIANDPFTTQELINLVEAQIPTEFPTISTAGTLGAQQHDSESQSISWSVSGDVTTIDATVWKYEGGTYREKSSESTRNRSGSLNFDHLGVGSYKFQVKANGYLASTWTHYVTVIDEDQSAPAIQVGGSSGTITDQQSREFSWSISDDSGISNSSVAVTGPGGRLFSSSDQAGLFSLNSYGPGFYRMVVNATDGDNDWSGDERVAPQQSRSVFVVDDDTEAPSISFSDRLGQPLLGDATSESHGLENEIAWDISDASGISSANATLRRDGVVVKSLAVDAIGSMNIDEFGLGQFELTLTVADGDNDGWDGDSLSTVSKAYLNITNQAPTVFVGGPYAIDEGDLLGLDSTGADVDPGDAESLNYSWDLDGDSVFGDVTSRNPVLTWQELQPFGMADDGTYPVVVRVEDTFGETAFSAALVTVNNAAPSISSIQAPPSVSENAPLTLTGAFTDAGSEDTHSVIVDWGDGSTSNATVDSLARTFSATHTYADDQPTSTASDNYTVAVTVIDDDGGVSGDELRSATAETSHVGGIEFPSFTSALPAGTNGLMLEAETSVQPQTVNTSAESAQEYSHTHTIDYPTSGLFNLPAVTTSQADASTNHQHTYPAVSQTVTTSNSSLASLYQRSTEQSFAMNAIDSSIGGTPADHQHVIDGAQFETSTQFTYDLPSTVISPSTQSNTNFVRLNGDARFSGINTHLTPRSQNKMGSIVVREARRTRSFNVNFDHEMFYSTTWGYGGISFGYAPMSTSSLFGAKGRRTGTGLWVTLENIISPLPIYNGSGFEIRYQNVGILSVYYNGTERGSWSVADGFSSSIRAGGLRNTFRNMTIDVSGTRVQIDNAATGRKTLNIPDFNPSSSWRFGFGGETDGLSDWNVLGRTTITDRSPERRTTSTIRRTSTDEYILPKFNSSLGTLRSAKTTLTLKAGTTQSAPATEVPHTHAVDLQVGDFSFVSESLSTESASRDHAHEVDFSPLVRTYSNASPEAARYAELDSVIVPFGGATTSTDFGHSHTIAGDSIQFDATTTFQYDASKTLIQVQNAEPALESLSLDAEVDENGTATLSGSFSDQGLNDTHQIEVNWGDGNVETLSIPFGSTSFAAVHHYRDDNPSGTDGDTYTVTVRIEDDDTGAAQAVREITVRNLTPVLNAPTGFSVDEGQLFELPQTSFSDAGVFDTHSLAVDWGDGASQLANLTSNAGAGIATASHAYADNGNFNILLTLSDDDSATDTASVPVTVNNLPPEIQSISGQLSGAEGASLAFTAVATDPGADMLTYEWDFGDGSTPLRGVDLSSAEHLFANDGAYTVRLTVTDDDGDAVVEELAVNVSDVAARMLVSGPATTNEGDVYRLSLGEIDDPGNDPIQGIQVNWGDGSTVVYPAPGIVEHTFANGTASANIEVSIVDEFGNVQPIATVPVSIRNLAPLVESLSVPTGLDEGGTATFNATATDPGEDPLTYTWDFGDGTPFVSGPDLTAPSHIYADDGVYLVQLNVSDDEGLADTKQAVITVSNVSPSVSVTGAASTNEGAAYELEFADLLDPGTDSITEVLVDWGDGSIQTYPSLDSVAHVYAEGPLDTTVLVTLVDEDGFHPMSQTVSVSVENVAPTIDDIAGDLSGLEGEALTFSASVSDPGGPFDVLTYVWNWGDGAPLESGIDLVNASHVYADDGSYSAALTVTDDEGDSSTSMFTVEVLNQVPTVALASVPEVFEGDAYTFTVGPITDAGADTVSQFEVNWGDGNESTYTIGETPSHVFADDVVGNLVSVSLIDEDGRHAGVAELTVDILNRAPEIVTLNGDQNGTEGQSFSFAAVATDAGADDLPLDYSWDFGDGNSQAGSGLASVSHAFTDDGQYLVSLTVSDSDGGQQLRQLLVTVDNVAPTVTATLPPSITEGTPFELMVDTIVDPGEDAVLEWLVDWGDGTLEPFVVGSQIDHVYANGNAEYEIEIHARDEDGFHNSVGGTTATVENAAASLTLLSDALIVMPEGGVAEIAAVFSDLGILDSHSVEIDWGDGETTTISNAIVDLPFAELHTYDVAGIYTAQIAVTDFDGATTGASVTVDVRPQVVFALRENGYETGARPVEFEASISRPLAQDVVLSYTLGGTATAGDDYTPPTSFELVIPAGQSRGLLSIPVIDDLQVESLESVVASATSIADGPEGVTLGTSTTAIGIIWDNDPDLDLDGVSAATEDLASNGGDGNADGIPDKEQPHVASLPNATDSQVVTFVAPNGTQFENVLSNNTFPEGAPEGVEFPLGVFAFELSGVTVGGAAQVTQILPAQYAPTSFYKFGPTPENPDPHWYDFSFDAASGTGAQFDGNTVNLYFVDGQRGDNDLLANGVITDPGAVAVASNSNGRLLPGGPYVVAQGESINLSPTFEDELGMPFTDWEWDTDYDGQTFVADLFGQQPELTVSRAGIRTMAVRATDSNGDQLLTTTSLTILNLPPVANDDFASTSENTPIEIDLLQNDVDPGSDVLNIRANSVQLVSATTDDQPIPLATSAWSVSGGILTFAPGSDFDFLSSVETASLVFEYELEDDSVVPMSDTAQVTLAVRGQNDVPSMTPGNPIIVDDAMTFREFSVRDFVGTDSSVGSPSLISDLDQDDEHGIMLYETNAIESLAVSLDDGLTFQPIDLSALSLDSAILLPPNALLAAEFASVSLGEFSYLPWDGSFGSVMQLVDAELLQEVGQLQTEPGTLRLIAVESSFPATVEEGTDFFSSVAADPAATAFLTTFATHWSGDQTTSVAAGEEFVYQYPNGPLQVSVSPSAMDATGVVWPLDSLNIFVENVAPTITDVQSNAPNADEASQDGWVQAVGSFADLGVLDTHEVIVEWGDGSSSAATVDQSTNEFAASHQYQAGGRYQIMATITDDQGDSVDEESVAFVEGVGLVGDVLWIVGTDEKDKIKIDRKTRGGRHSREEYIDVDARLDRERFRLEFEAQLVSSIHIVTRGDKDDIDLKRDVDLPVTIDSGAGDDKIDVRSGIAAIYAGPGRDKVDTANGDDFVDGGTGDDDIDTGDGNDTIVDPSGNNRIKAGDGDDMVTLGDGRDDVDLGDGNDWAWLGGGDDKADGDDGDDVIFGQAGDDRIDGDRGNDVIVGGEGDDRIDGDRGLDVLIGGVGADRIDGGRDDDLLIAGWTFYDDNLQALQRVMMEWSSEQDYAQRVENLRAGTGANLVGTRLAAGETVFDDGVEDRLDGDSGRDWFFGSLADEIKRKKANELLDLL